MFRCRCCARAALETVSNGTSSSKPLVTFPLRYRRGPLREVGGDAGAVSSLPSPYSDLDTKKPSIKARWQSSARRLEMPSPECCQKLLAIDACFLGYITADTIESRCDFLRPVMCLGCAQGTKSMILHMMPGSEDRH